MHVSMQLQPQHYTVLTVYYSNNYNIALAGKHLRSIRALLKILN